MKNQFSLSYINNIPISDKKIIEIERFAHSECSSQELALACFSNPQFIYCVNERNGDFTLFTYDVSQRCFMYQCPNNIKRNKWYEARGLMSHLKRYMRDVLPIDFF